MLVPDPGEDARAAIKTAMKAALDQYLSTFGGRPVDTETQNAINELKGKVGALETKLAETPAADSTEKLRVELESRITGVEKSIAKLEARVAQTLDQFCSIDQIQRRGFQIMGPEGMRPFDQDQRLILAMHSSAKPLIETLSEYSGRLLTPQVNPAEQLLPLAREITTIVRTQRALDGKALEIAEDPEGETTLDEIFDAAAEAFTPEVK